MQAPVPTQPTIRPAAPASQADATYPERSEMRRTLRSIVAEYLGVGMLAALVAAIATAFAFQVWDMSLYRPPGLGGDGMLALEVVKTITKHGWYFYNPDLAAPFGQELYDFAVFSGDALSLAMIEVLGWFADDPLVVGNVFFLATFPLAAFVGAIVLRAWGISVAMAVAFGTLFALAPYHFERGFGHYFLSAYFTVPIGVHLALCIATGRRLFHFTGSDAIRTRSGVGRNAWTAALCAACALGGLYYAVFTIILLVGAGVLRALAQLNVRALIPSAAASFIIIAVLAVACAPNLIHSAREGANHEVGQRVPFESEVFGLKISHMLLPASQHRIDALAEARHEYVKASPVPSEPGQELGTIGAIGFLILLGHALSSVLRSRGLGRSATTPLDGLAALTLIAVLVGTIGGFSALFATLVTPQIRGWNRISIVISFVCLMAVAMLLDRLVRRLGRGLPRRMFAIGAGMAVAVVILGYFDQTNTSNLRQSRAAVAKEFDFGSGFVDGIDAVMPPRAMVFQLPYVPFPENPPVNGMSDYEHFRPYLYDTDLRWSYGAMRGRESEWGDELAQSPDRELPELVTAAGFQGLYVDRRGYADGGVQLANDLRPVLGGPTIESGDGRFAFYDLRKLGETQRMSLSKVELSELRASVLHPVQIEFEGFYDQERDGDTSWRWMPRSGSITLELPSDESRTIVMRADVQVGTEHPTTLSIELPDGSTRDLAIRGRKSIELQLELRPDRQNVLRIESNAPAIEPGVGDDRELVAQWFDLEFDSHDIGDT